jgi:predicted membrane chloride channel (bestrophin family)
MKTPEKPPDHPTGQSRRLTRSSGHHTPRSYVSSEGLERNKEEEELEEGQSLLYKYSRRTLKADTDESDGRLLRYDVDRMMSWPALFQWTGTVVSHGALWKTCAVYWVISISLALFFYMCHLLHAPIIMSIKIDSDKNLEHLATVTTYITALLGFMIGFFVSISLNRWWSLRDNCIGGMHRAINDMQLFLAIRLTDPTDRLLKDTALRLCLLAHRLVFMEAQNREEPEDLRQLIEVGMLTDDEFIRLQHKHRKAQLVLVWLDSFYHGPVMASGRINYKHVRTLDMNVAQLRASIGQIFTYINTQLPYSYVHLLSCAVLLSNTMLSVKVGIAIGRNMAPDTPTDIVYQMVQAFQVFFVPFSYHAFIRLCEELSNPLGDNFGAFPGYAFHCQLRDNCQAMHEAALNPPPALRVQAPRKDSISEDEPV